MDANIKITTTMREFDKIFSVRPQEPEYFLPTRLAGWATLVTSEVQNPSGVMMQVWLVSCVERLQ